MGENSKPVTIYKTQTIKEKLYEIVPSRGDKYIVGKSHDLVLKASNCEMTFWDDKRKRYKARYLKDFKIIDKIFSLDKYDDKESAEEEAKKFLKNQNGVTKYGDIMTINMGKFYEIPSRVRDVHKCFSVGLEFMERKVDIDPYAIGYWLGDGNSDGVGITTAEKEVVKYYTKFAEDIGMEFKYVTRYHYNVTTGTQYGGAKRNIFFNALKKYNLIKNKHIPIDYKFNSRENRLKLLAGIIDSDGSYSNNTYDICFKSEKLTDDVIFLVRSLGFFTHKQKVKRTCTNGKNGPVTGDYFRFHVCGEGLQDIPVLVPRKKAHKRESAKNANVNGIKIKEVGEGDCCRC